jgi:hypothetical protein
MSGNQGENSAGRNCAISAKLSDATGITTTVALAATPQALLGALFAQEKNWSGGLLSWTPATGRVALVGAQGKGRYRAICSVSDVIGPNSADLGMFVALNGTRVSNNVKSIQLGTAARGNMGVAIAEFDLDDVGDFVDVRLSVGANGQAVVVRDAFLTVEKVG